MASNTRCAARSRSGMASRASPSTAGPAGSGSQRTSTASRLVVPQIPHAEVIAWARSAPSVTGPGVRTVTTLKRWSSRSTSSQ